MMKLLYPKLASFLLISYKATSNLVRYSLFVCPMIIVTVLPASANLGPFVGDKSYFLARIMLLSDGDAQCVLSFFERRMLDRRGVCEDTNLNLSRLFSVNVLDIGNKETIQKVHDDLLLYLLERQRKELQNRN